MSFFKRIINVLQRSRQKEALNYLESMSERQLMDCGFSPKLVSQGLRGWPWRIDSITPDAAVVEKMQMTEPKQEDLFTEVELANLGIRRDTREAA